jgi:hypothetical protein
MLPPNISGARYLFVPTKGSGISRPSAKSAWVTAKPKSPIQHVISFLIRMLLGFKFYACQDGVVEVAQATSHRRKKGESFVLGDGIVL